VVAGEIWTRKRLRSMVQFQGKKFVPLTF